MKPASNPSITGFIAFKRRTVTIDTLAAQRLLKARGCHYPLTIQMNRVSLQNEYTLENSQITISLAPFVVAVRIFGAIPLFWPAALTPLSVWRRDIATTLAHEMRHALQYCGAVPESAAWRKPFMSYTQVRNMARLYVLLAVTILAPALLYTQDIPPTTLVWLLLLLLVSGFTVLTLAIVCYCAAPDEIDARQAERTDWKNWESMITIVPS